WAKFLIDPFDRDLYLRASSLTYLVNFFFSQFKIIEAAGGLVFNSNEALLCIYRWGKWDLPKGKIEKGEKKEEAAIREVEEETGITGLDLEVQLPTTYHIYKSPYHKNKWVLKPTYWFKMKYSGVEELVPQTKEDITKAIWVKESDLGPIQQNTYASLQDLFIPKK
ncbi:MAG: NUDIX domain-containing protein, partial [Prolixibacteraceae bacterium]|nr:NUDIX domain-containing protein [Prolixibacteraceae bacterium]